MKKKSFKTAFFASLGLFGLTVFTSCDKDDTGNVDPVISETKSVFVLNEGSYGSSNASVRLFNKVSKTVQNNIFTMANNRPLGDVLQSMVVHQDKGFLVVNNSNTVEVVNINTFQSLGVITGLEQPRYFAALSNATGYVTEWGSTFGGNGKVSVVDLTTYAVTKTIPVGKQPEQLLLHDNKLYVANYGETFISVINITTNAVENTIQVGEGPKEFNMDASGNMWVLCGGFYQPDFSTTPGSLVKFNPANPTAKTTLPFNGTTSQPEDLTINGAKDKLYYSYQGAVYAMPIQATTLPASPFVRRYFYGIGIDPADNTIYAADAGNFSSNGKVIRFNTSGTAIDSFQVDVAPNGFVFR